MAKKKKVPSEATSGTSPSSSAAAARREIRRLDREILALINRRAELTQPLSTAEAKAAFAGHEADIQDTVRRSKGPLPPAAVQGIFRELASGCRAIHQSLRVAYLGPEFTFSHLAAVHRFGQSVQLSPVTSIRAVFEEVQNGQADFGLVPIENSTDGRVTDTLDMFAKLPVKICGEVLLPIHHCLLGRGSRAEVRSVFSKPQALSQCRNWLATHLGSARVEEMSSTADAARRALDEEGAAAVASLQAGIHYGLDVLAENIEDDPRNQTRFAVIAREAGPRTGNDKTSLMFEVAHEPGALADAMTVFKRNRLNLTWIESFPIPGCPGRYLFFVELLGHPSELRVRRAMTALEKKAIRLEILGSYARMNPVQ